LRVATSAAQSRPAGAFPVAHIDLVEEARQLRASPMPHGHVAKTVLRNSDLRVVMMVLKRGTKVPTHHARGSLAIQVLDGRLVVTLLDTGFDLAAGNVLAIESDVEHALIAIEDTAVMLTVAHRQ